MQANTKSSLKYLNCLLSPGTLHSLWTHAGKDNISIQKACVRARIVTGAYILQKDRSKFYGSREKPDCNLCKDGVEDIGHFILRCKTLEIVRKPFIDLLQDVLNEIDIGILNFINDRNLLLQLILDERHPSIPMIVQSRQVGQKIESIARGLCFALHRDRCRRLDINVG